MTGGGSCGGSYYNQDYHVGTASQYAVDFNLYINGCGTSDNGYPVVSMADGVVSFAGYNTGGYGNMVKMTIGTVDAKKVELLYAHFDSAPLVQQGEQVKRGQVIGYIGHTGGTSTGDHLHVEERWGNVSVEMSPIDGQTMNSGTVLLSHNTNLFDLERNGSGSYGTRQDGLGDYAGVHWHSSYSSSGHFRTNSLSNNCFMQNWAGGTYGNCAIVYDALGGARRAYTIHTGFYHNGTNGWDDLGGPTSTALGMPLTNEYSWQGKTRQDFQSGYLLYQQGHTPTEVWTNSYTAPGWTSSGWNTSYSYLFAAAYERNGSAATVGTASGNVYDYGPYKRQDFSGGSFGNCCIMYDPNNATGNPMATNEAYLLRTGFYNYYQANGNYSAFGCPSRDEYATGDPGDAIQFFVRRVGSETQQHHMYFDASQGNQVSWHSTYTCSYASQTPAGQFNMAQGTTQALTVRFLNTGAFTWHNDPGAYPYDYVQLKSCDQNGVVCNSFLNDPPDASLNWFDQQTPCSMVEASVAPGETATFTFIGKVASNAPLGLKGVYFRPVHSVGGLMDNWGGMYFPINVTPYVVHRTRYDFDGDGKADIVFLDKRDTGYLRVDYTSNGIWPLDASYQNYGIAPGIWACPGDFNGDHIADFAQINPAYSNGMFQINYGPVLVDGFTSNFDNYGTGTIVPVVADFNGDGYDDYSQYEPARGYWSVNYGPDFASGFELMLPNYGNWGYSPCAGDFDGDGKADLLMMYRWTGYVYINYAYNGFNSGYDNLPGYPNYGVSDGIIPMAGDVNGDGYDDYVQYEMDTGYLRINYGPNIANGFEEAHPGYPTGTDVNPMLADFDGDGKLDLLVYNKATWTIGIDYAGNGFNGLEFFRTYFNPDGSSAKYAPPDEDQLPPAPSFKLWSVPNPAKTSGTINFTLPVADWVSISIYDAGGREVAAMPLQTFEAGQHAFYWGKSVQSIRAGIYFIRLTSSLHTATTRMVILN